MRTPRRGPKTVTFEGRKILLRDQDYLHRGNMALPRGFSFADLVEAINRRIFFWAGTSAGPVPSGLRHFQRYHEERPVILRLPFESLVGSNRSIHPLFCPYNSGSPRCTNGSKSPRGPDTFLPADAFNRAPCQVVEVTFNTQILLPPSTEIGMHPEGPWKKFL